MKPLSEFPNDARRAVRFVLCDIDDTITERGRLPAASLDAMERLRAAAIRVMPVTGRPAGRKTFYITGYVYSPPVDCNGSCDDRRLAGRGAKPSGE